MADHRPCVCEREISSVVWKSQLLGRFPETKAICWGQSDKAWPLGSFNNHQNGSNDFVGSEKKEENSVLLYYVLKKFLKSTSEFCPTILVRSNSIRICHSLQHKSHFGDYKKMHPKKHYTLRTLGPLVCFMIECRCFHFHYVHSGRFAAVSLGPDPVFWHCIIWGNLTQLPWCCQRGGTAWNLCWILF